MNGELRELIEIARIEAEYALADLTFFAGAHSTSAIEHVKGVIERLDEALEKMGGPNEPPSVPEHD